MYFVWWFKVTAYWHVYFITCKMFYFVLKMYFVFFLVNFDIFPHKMCEKRILLWKTYVHSYSFHKSIHSNGSGQMTFEHGLFDGQFRSKFRAIVAWPHCVPFIAGGSGRCLPSNLSENRFRLENPFNITLIVAVQIVWGRGEHGWWRTWEDEGGVI